MSETIRPLVQETGADDGLPVYTLTELIQLVDDIFASGQRSHEVFEAELKLERLRRLSPPMREWQKLVGP